MPTNLEVICREETLPVGSETRCSALATYDDGTVENVRREAVWASDDTDVAVVENLLGFNSISGEYVK